MKTPFNAGEIFEMAIQIERNGARFYRLAADRTTDPRERQLLTELAAMEEEHERIFASMREELSAGETGLRAFDPQGEALLYLRAMAEGHVFDPEADPKEMLGVLDGMEGVLRKAIDLEKESIIFYLGMREMVPKRLGKDKIEHIIREEMRHIVLLNGELNQTRRSWANRER